MDNGSNDDCWANSAENYEFTNTFIVVIVDISQQQEFKWSPWVACPAQKRAKRAKGAASRKIILNVYTALKF